MKTDKNYFEIYPLSKVNILGITQQEHPIEKNLKIQVFCVKHRISRS